MVKFDSDSIYQRVIEKLQQDPNWSVITNNSVISALVRQNAEVLSETARYSEYLFKEMGYSPEHELHLRYGQHAWISA